MKEKKSSIPTDPTTLRCGREKRVKESSTEAEQPVTREEAQKLPREWQAEEESELIMNLLKLITSAPDRRELMKAITRLIHDWSGCEAVGVRLREGDDFPYYETMGFSPDFVMAESRLCAQDSRGETIRDSQGNPVMECMCGNILCGRFNPAQPFFTPRGSFWTNSTSVLLNRTNEADRMARTRNRCNGEGYESVALIPMRAGGETFGLLQFNDRRIDRFTSRKIALLEQIADHLATSLAQRLAAEALCRSEERFRELASLAPAGIYMADTAGKRQYVNSRWCQMAGLSSEEAAGDGWIKGLFIEDRERVLSNWQKMAQSEGQWGHEYRFQSPEGRITWVHGVATAVRDQTGRITEYIGVNTDITERKQMEAILLESEEKYRSIFSAAKDAIVILEHETGRILDVNSFGCNLYGYTRDEMLAMSNLNLSAKQNKTVSGLKNEIEWIPICYHKKKDGTVFPVEISVSHMTQRGLRISTSIIRDISERQRAEEEKGKLEAQLRQAQKMEAIGTLAGGIAHDFNNILGAIMGFTDMALEEIKEGSLAHRDLEQVRKASYRAKDLVKQILAFSHKGETQERRPVEMGPIIEEALKLLRATLPTTIEIRQEIARSSRFIMADPTQIHQIIVNLCTNAAHAMSEHGGVLEVKTAVVKRDVQGGEEHRLLKPGSYLELSVGDTGHGMDKATMERIFDPYFTTKRVGEGSGLGLAVVHGIVKRHEGAVRVHSEPGRGTIFQLLFPIVGSSPELESIGQVPLRKGSERILFVDDEEALVAFGKRMLRSLGYEVTAKTDSLEALDLFRAQPDAFDLVITDHTMAHRTGIELAGEMLRIRPDVPIILCTGFSAGITAEMAGKVGIREFAMKPLSVSNISEVIRKVLDKA